MPSRFDRAVWLLMAATLLALLGVVWRGDQVGLRVTTLSPPADAVGVSSSTLIHVRFDQALRADAADSPQLTFDPPLTGTVRLESDALIFTPATGLAPDTTYAARLDAGLSGRTGRRLLAPVMWRFTTGHTSIVYSVVDAQRHEQLMLAAANLGPDAVTLAAPQAVTNADFGIWDFGVDGRTGQIVFSLLAADGTEAVAIYAARPHDIAVVLTDMMMPVMDGLATMQALRRINPNLPFMGSCVNAPEEVRALARREGTRHFLGKPYTAEVLLTTVRAALDG